MLLAAVVSGHAEVLNEIKFLENQPETVHMWVTEMSTKAALMRVWKWSEYMENKEFTIGESTNRLLTKSDLINLIENNFSDDNVGNIAVLTTTKAGDYKNPVIMQSLTISKVLTI